MSISEIAAPDAALPPRFAEALSLFADRHWDAALVVCEQLLASQGECPEAMMLLGLISYELDEPVQATELLARACEMAPDIRDYAEAVAAVEARLGNTAEALFQLKLATTLTPHPSGQAILPASYANFFANIESASPNKFRKRAERLLRTGDLKGAEAAADMQLRLTPGDPATLRLLARIWRMTGQIEPAIAALHAVLHAAPSAADRSTLAGLLAQAGRHDEAARVDTLAQRAAPGNAEIARSALLNLARNPDAAPASLDTARRAWLDRFVTASPTTPVAASARAGQRFSIGIVGNRFGEAETAHRIAPVLDALKKRGAVLFAYSDDNRQDAVSDRTYRHAERRTCLKGVDPETAAAILRGDGIDVVLDLTGFGNGARLATYAWQPARLSLSWCGSVLPAAQPFDWLVAGPEAPSDKTVWRLPRTPLVYPAPTRLQPPNALPALSVGYPTFGTALPLGAIGGATLALWTDLLAAIPSARLLVANIARLDDACVARTYEQISHAGLRQRVDIVDFEPGPFVDLDFWRHVDIALDPQPIGSFSQTARALWSGVPVIALRGSGIAGRAGATALAAAGRTNWIADDNATAIAIARDLLGDAGALAALRAALPASLANSPLADADGLAADLIAAFGEMLAR